MIHIKSSKSFIGFFVLSLLIVASVVAMPSSASVFANPAVVNLGEAGNFAVLSSTAISNISTSVITGDIGVSPAAATAITGFTCPAVTGTVHVVSAGGDTLACQTVDPEYLTPTVLSYEAAYTDAQGRTADATISTALDGLTYTPGVYTAANLDLSSGSTVTLDCGGDANGVFIFQTAGHLSVGTSANVDLINSCQPGNVFWAVAGATDILGGVSTPSTFQGTVLGGQGVTEISLGVGSTVFGRLMSDKTISLQGNIITVPTITTPTTGPVFIDTNVNNILDSGEQFFNTIQEAVTASVDNDTIVVTAGTYGLSAQLNISKPLSIIGQGIVTVKPVSDFGSVNGSKHLLTIYAGTLSNPVTVSNIVLDSDSKAYGVNTYSNAYGILNDVTITNSKGAGLTVNGSTIVATNLNTSGSSWGAVNVDPGTGVMTPSVLTLNSGTLAESNQIWSDGSKVNGVATVTVNATGYNVYKKGGTSAFYVWTNRALSSVATIGNTYYTTIQAAITAASTTVAETINVTPGTYAVGQIVINKNLSIVGDSSSKPVFQPTGNFTVGNASGAWMLVQPGISFNLSNVVIDGNTSFVNFALRSHGNTTINNVDFQKIWGSANGIGSPYQGIAVSSFGGTVPGGAGADSHSTGGTASHLTITNSTFANIGRIGALIKGTGSTATINGNTYTGKGDGDFLDYAFEFGAGGSGTVSGNNISGNRGVAADTSTSAGVLVTEYYGSGTNAVINGNTFSNNIVGLHVGYLDTDASVVTANGNNFSGEAVGIESDATTVTVNAENNWWGTASSTEIALKALGLVDFDPYYTSAAMTTLSSGVATNATYTSTTVGEANLPTGVTEVVLTNTTVMDLSDGLVGDAVVLQSGTEDTPIILTNSSLVGFSASIPDGTTITGPAGWDGMITPPVSETSSGNAPSGFTVGGTVISVGSPDGTLVFSNPVTLFLAGVTGTVGYMPSGSNTWTQITNACASPYATPGNPPAGSECAINDGTNTKIVTYHFTSFGELDPIPPTPTPTPAPSGGGGPVGLFGAVTNNSAGVQNAQAVVAQTLAVTNAATPATPTPRGLVLGASTFRFTKALSVGSRGDEVIELQNRLISEGLLSSEATGYYGSLTSQAVKAFQAKYGISQAGVVGPQTREKLNGTSASASDGSQFGAAVSAFARSLSQGSRGDEVTKLQERLTAEGVYTGPITGYFGALTRASVEAYQEMKGLEKVGVVGPKTRAELNK